jgi:hypothetical protein
MLLVRNGLKKGDALTSLLFNFSLEYPIKKNQVNQDALVLNGTHQLLIYADDINMTETHILYSRTQKLW